MRLTRWSAALTAVILLLTSKPVQADQEKGEVGERLIRVSEINVPLGGQPLGPNFGVGTDPLREGSVQVMAEDGKVQAMLRGAAPNALYSLFFCRFGYGPGGCILIGSAEALKTDGDGNGRLQADLPFTPGGANAWAGTFAVFRTVGGSLPPQFVTGFRVRSKPNNEDADIKIEGTISSINSNTSSFRVGNLQQDIFVDSATEFHGKANKFSDLTVGERVEVTARVQSDAKLLAHKIESGGPETNVPRGRGPKH